ncbi:MAG: UDP-N-acetylmuramoyl-L-alanyl-D-glutamate--2,6-diaminopimelate ligase [Bacteroidetes bacterium]|nr:UDP-N-acetylmuramoyl-L-alanyl-D-glutamate--2,6-diaminopimelate ligase [Bacteroidota bacterium]
MTLSKVLEGVPVIKMFQTMYGRMVVTHDVEVRGIQYDSRKVERDFLFVAIRGETADGHKFIDHAVKNGAKVVVVEDDAALPDHFFMHAGVVKIVVQDARKALASIAANYYQHPSKKLRLVGVTGTNGKTTTTHLIKSILERTGEHVGLIGTIAYSVGDEVIPATHTTPESLELNQLLSAMVQQNCSAAVIEVSSHALAMDRVFGLDFEVGVFTNLTQDHLDFHGSMDKYFAAKRILFDGLDSSSFAVVNVDDSYGKRIAVNSKATRLTYSAASAADVFAADIRLSVRGSEFQVEHAGARTTISSSLAGRFNVSNILAAYSTGVALDVPRQQLVEGIQNLKTVRGRFEQIISPAGWTAVVDYAHTPDALENCLRTIHDILPKDDRGRIITTFGCGGNRDRGKRPLMGKIATELSNITIVTSDNPRNEDPQAIIDEIMVGVVKGKEVHTEADRGKAIRMALGLARRGDVVLVAGKGHEDYQVVGTEKHHFDDREEIERFIRANS